MVPSKPERNTLLKRAIWIQMKLWVREVGVHSSSSSSLSVFSSLAAWVVASVNEIFLRRGDVSVSLSCLRV